MEYTETEQFLNFINKTFKKGHVYRGFGKEEPHIFKNPTGSEAITKDMVWMVLGDEGIQTSREVVELHVLGQKGDGYVGFAGFSSWIESLTECPVERLYP